MSEGSMNASLTSNNQEAPEVQKGIRNNNVLGKNQYKDWPLADDPHIAALLKGYHLEGITDSRIVSKRLLEEHGVTLGHTSISRRRKKFGLWASRHTTAELSESAKTQLVLDQMAKDPTGKLGATSVKQRIFQDTGLHLTRDYIREEMKKLDPLAHAARGPTHIKEKRRKLQELRAASGSETPLEPNFDPVGPSSQTPQPPRGDPYLTANVDTSSHSRSFPDSANHLQDLMDMDYSDNDVVHCSNGQAQHPSNIPLDQALLLNPPIIQPLGFTFLLAFVVNGDHPGHVERDRTKNARTYSNHRVPAIEWGATRWGSTEDDPRRHGIGRPA